MQVWSFNNTLLTRVQAMSGPYRSPQTCQLHFPASHLTHSPNVSAIPSCLQPCISPNASISLLMLQALLWCPPPLPILPLTGWLAVILSDSPQASSPQGRLPLTFPILAWVRCPSPVLSKHSELASITALVPPYFSCLFIYLYPSLDYELPKGRDYTLLKILSVPSCTVSGTS